MICVQDVIKVQRIGSAAPFDHVRSHDASSSPSSDTVGRSGMFCAITMVTQQCKAEGVMDVSQKVKAIRTHMPGVVLTVAFIFIYLLTSLCYISPYY